MRNASAYKELRNRDEYKRFKNKSRVRSLIGIIVMLILGITMINANNSSVSPELVSIMTSACFIGVFLMAYFLVMSFRKPKDVIKGEIIEIKEKKRTVNSEDRLQTRKTHVYLVSNGKESYWSECIKDYIDGIEEKHYLGEQVLCFSKSSGDYYIVRTSNESEVR